MAIIVGIHGLSNKPEETKEAVSWEKAIREGLKKNCQVEQARFTYHMVYWANRVYKVPLHDDEGYNFDALYNDEPYIEAAAGALQSSAPIFFDKLKIGVTQLLGTAFDAVKSNAELQGLSDLAVAKVKPLRDLAFYYDEDRKIRDRQEQMRQARRVLMDELSSALRKLKGQRIMLIAHSMGTIIAYDVLREFEQSDPSFELAHFVTIGSPLGLKYVKDRVRQEEERRSKKFVLPTPAVITEKWVNYADPHDPVATDTALTNDYQPNPKGIKVQDQLVQNDYVGLSKKPNHHKSYGYLRTPELSRHIRDFLEESR